MGFVACPDGVHGAGLHRTKRLRTVARASVRLAIVRDRCGGDHRGRRCRRMDAREVSPMKKLSDLEVILRADEIRAMATRIVRKVEGIPIPTPALMLDLVQRGILRSEE